ncbi:MAG: hypothetical protein HW414_572 [Dehalococcoidia bacterium]|nr:hypothetical protein [Dehalococcoidia bacterium]
MALESNQRFLRIAIAAVLVLAIAATLWFAPSVKAVNTTLPDFPTAVTRGTSITFTAQVDINTNELIPIVDLRVDITGPSPAFAVFNLDGAITSQSGHFVSIVPQVLPQFGFGYRSGTGFGSKNSVTGNHTFLFGYGYGYGSPTLVAQAKYLITVNTSDMSPGSYLAQLAVNVTPAPDKFLSPSYSIDITPTAGGGGGGVAPPPAVVPVVVPLPPPPPPPPPPPAPPAPAPPAPSLTAETLLSMPAAQAAALLEAAPASQAAQLIQLLPATKAAEILSAMQTGKASQIMELIPTATLAQIVAAMPEAALINMLPLLSISTLHSIPASALFAALPNTPTVHLVGTVPPTPPPNLTTPVVLLVTPTQERFVAIRTEAGEWVVLAGTPIPVTKLMIKTREALSIVETTIEQLPTLPADIKTAPAGAKVVDYFTITLKNAPPKTVAAGYIEFKVEKSWLNANSIHPWSVALNRFDDKLGQWMPLETKKIREDASLVYYSATLPQLSLFAITGSAAAPVREYSVEQISITPTRGPAGKTVQVSAEVTSMINEERTFPMTLWVNSAVEEAQLVKVPAKGKATVTFTVTKANAGDYEVRIDRGMGRLTVTGAKGTFIRLLLYGIGALVVAAAIVFFAILRRRKAVPIRI